MRACQRGIGVALLPDYLVEQNGGLVQLFGETDAPAVDAYFVYPEELKIGCARPGVSRFPGQQRAALELLSGPAMGSISAAFARAAWLPCGSLHCDSPKSVA